MTVDTEQLSDTIASIIGEGVHAGLRKYGDSRASLRAHADIDAMPDGEWAEVVGVVAEVVIAEVAEAVAGEVRGFPFPHPLARLANRPHTTCTRCGFDVYQDNRDRAWLSLTQWCVASGHHEPKETT